MLAETFITAALFATSALAAPAPDPVQLMSRAPQPGVVIRQCAQPGMLALAYDDGPGQYTSRLVDILNAGGAKATFFMTGTLYGCIYNQAAAIKKAYASGHQLASHTWSHGHMNGFSAAQVASEMTKVETAFANIIGKKPRYMRPPFLETGNQVLPVLKSMGYKVITDDVDTGDWNRQTPAQSEAKFYQAGARGNGHIPLMHEVYQSTVEQLTPWLINWAKQNNLKLVTVAECLGDKNGMYQPQSFPVHQGQLSC
ncbi:carbohydrate esterase family 4 protein [Neurospora crassa]|uniref:Chitin deacetylase n=1 Tax=Neurospora crassa (strain ATCC 24698 / 74-OR23-1A / CBS 708.71 / DSM 1257 / FGSC 987) TaxID=367110 RepID=Q7S4L8_NEUCR|nr:chitin deacetylase [Neurospora crassa OR74A]EAA30457.2 chitin deacetylase [Neurospora crassa OR74A]KHE81538.1 carbohydrate esterase family 4 protein [Neurospora crassa]|eukprot:XP_959693.2 chitin deacetylase [Neurospora crassa OR74A]